MIGMTRYEAFVDRGWKNKGITQVVVVRIQENGWIEAGVFLVDFWCLGVKDAFATEMSVSEWNEEAARLMPVEDRESFHPACARKLVEGAVAYALALGISPPHDYKKARRIFGSVKAQDCPQSFTYGKNGKPFYVAGPNDDEERIDRVLRILTARLGEDGFHYIVPQEPEESDGFDRDELLDLFYDRPGGNESFASIDGFLTALNVCPTVIHPGKFLPVVLSSAPRWLRDETDPKESSRLLLSQWQRAAERLTSIDADDPPELAVDFGDELEEDGGLRSRAAAWCQGFLRVVHEWPEEWCGGTDRAGLRPHIDAIAVVAAYAGSPAPAGVTAPAEEEDLPRYIGTAVIALRAVLRPEFADESPDEEV